VTAELLEIRSPSEQTEGTRSQVLRWMKGVGDPVEKNEPLLEIETDKVTVEVPAPGSGILESILKQEQEEIAPGELLGRLRITSTTGATAPVAAAASATTSDAATADRGERLSPAVRRLIAEHGLDASAIEGTGQGGRITVEDVQRHLAAAATVPAVGKKAGASTRLVPHTPMRRRIADHMVESLLRTAPHVTTVFEANLARVLANRASQRESFAQRGANLTLTAYFVAAMVDAVRAVPQANSRWTAAGIEINESVHVGVATALGAEGLVVPVLRDAHRLDLFSIARALDELVSKAREHKLVPQDLQGGTITISNHGVSGSLIATPIVINQPQSSIVGIGKLEKRAVVVEENGADRLLVQPRCYVTLTIDHRVLDGFAANRFLQVFVERLENWT
jgi:2-oxoglutarate dehydrogenase E2 component (dihydrolipoamide succinyltransferase)